MESRFNEESNGIRYESIFVVLTIAHIFQSWEKWKIIWFLKILMFVIKFNGDKCLAGKKFHLE